MDKKFDLYIDLVISKIGCDITMEKQIREDLLSMLYEKKEAEGISDPYKLLGDPLDIAKEFKDNLGIKDTNGFNICFGMPCGNFEYISKTRLFGVPLFHASLKPFSFTKGIISIGMFPVGIIALGAVPFGIISLGAIAFGILAAIGGCAASAGISFGGAAISYFMSFGGFAVANNIAVGGFAVGHIAIGAVAKGTIAVFNQSGTGDYLFKAPVNIDKVMTTVKNVYPGMGKTILKVIRCLITSGFE